MTKTRRAARLGLLLLALAGPGCACGLPERLPAPELLEPCRSLPQCCRSHVHVFLINTVDPCDAGDLGGVRAFLIDLGFIKTSSGQLYHADRFANEVRQIRACDPDAHFILIGFDRGAAAAQEQAEILTRDGVPIDLVVYLDGVFLPDRPPPPGVRVVNVHNAAGFCDTGALRQADNLVVPECGHFAVPTHPVTLELLAHELAQVAESVPMRPLLPPAGQVAAPESAPTPRRVPPSEPTTGLSFLKPANTLPHPDAAAALDSRVPTVLRAPVPQNP
jgi:hypothetical protein